MGKRIDETEGIDLPSLNVRRKGVHFSQRNSAEADMLKRILDMTSY